jgi:hypothetical protein
MGSISEGIDWVVRWLLFDVDVVASDIASSVPFNLRRPPPHRSGNDLYVHAHCLRYRQHVGKFEGGYLMKCRTVHVKPNSPELSAGKSIEFTCWVASGRE